MKKLFNVLCVGQSQDGSTILYGAHAFVIGVGSASQVAQAAAVAGICGAQTPGALGIQTVQVIGDVAPPLGRELAPQGGVYYDPTPQ